MEILDLPNELFLSIGDYLSTKDLYHFLSTCQQLSSLLTPRLHGRGLQIEDGVTPLQRAAENGQASLAELAISKGAKVDKKTRREGGIYRSAALHTAASFGNSNVIRVLVKHGATIDSLDNGLRTPLFLAARWGHAGAVSVLLELGAVIPLEPTHHTLTLPTHVSAREGHVDCMRAFIDAGFDCNIRGPEGRTVLHEATDAFFGKVVEYLLEQEGGRAIINTRDSQGRTPLHYSAVSHRLGEEKVRLLLHYGADTTLKDNLGDTPADLAKREGLSSVCCIFMELEEDSDAPDEESECDCEYSC